VRACVPVAWTSTRLPANPWIGQNEMCRVRLCRASERHRSQTNRGGDVESEVLSGSTTKVISAYRGIKRPPPVPFQGAEVRVIQRPNRGSVRTAL
jgi:hypothetical protein